MPCPVSEEAMRRRDFLKGIASSTTAWPLVARAQQSDQLRRIGVLMGYPENDSEAQSYVVAFRGGLHTLGWTEGRNTRIDIRWATPGDPESMQRFAKELVTLQPDVILSQTTPTTAALVQQTLAIPIVFALVSDPVGSGFVASYRRPGGNVTGFDVSEPTQAGKWVELLKEITPRVARAVMLFNPESATYAEVWLNLSEPLARHSPSKRSRFLFATYRNSILALPHRHASQTLALS
jgi:putative tryptophan/tyrosine transport system substrate-binding protein